MHSNEKKWSHNSSVTGFWFNTFTMLVHVIRSPVDHETLEDEWYVVVKANYTFRASEILRDGRYSLSYNWQPHSW